MDIEIILRNSSESPDWIGSFTENLQESDQWNKEEFWKLHYALVQLAICLRDTKVIEKSLAGKICEIQQTVQSLISSHFDSNTEWEIKNISDDELYGFLERFDMAIQGVFSGEVLPENSFDLVNPLI